jgi:glycosyltransferase involved in cell wall biosynthesis
LTRDTGTAEARKRVGVDFHVFDGKFQGSRSHLVGLFSELLPLCPEYDFYFFLEDVGGLRSLPAFGRENAHAAHMPEASPAKRLLWQLPRLRRQYRLDLLHTQYVSPLWAGSAQAVTIHDVLFEGYPGYFTPLFVLRSRLLTRWSAHRAKLLCTVSEYSRHEIATRYGIDARRIEVLPNAADGSRFFPGKSGQDVVDRRGLQPRGYFLTVGRIEPRKNHARLLRAYGLLAGSPPPLVIVGQRDFHFDEFERTLASLPITHRVMVLDDVTDVELPMFYRHALAFVYPSLAEGFGMPPLEALASGTPVVSSDSTAMPEVLGSAALLVDPCDESALATALERVRSDPALRTRLIKNGLEHTASFSWGGAARRLAARYRELLDPAAVVASV